MVGGFAGLLSGHLSNSAINLSGFPWRLRHLGWPDWGSRDKVGIMIFFPAIDLKSGRVVRLAQGRADKETVYFEDATEPARRFQEAGAEWLHVVDLDGAFTGQQTNARAVEALLKLGLKVELGGGIRSVESVVHWLKLGVQRIVIGTKAVSDPAFLGECLRVASAEHLAVGIDAKDGQVAVRGWVDTVPVGALEFARRVEAVGIQTLIYTDISRDGMMGGPNLEAQEAMLQAVGLQVVASGGVSSVEDVRKLAELAQRYPHLEGVISGRALYDGRLDAAEALRAVR